MAVGVLQVAEMPADGGVIPHWKLGSNEAQGCSHILRQCERRWKSYDCPEGCPSRSQGWD